MTEPRSYPQRRFTLPPDATEIVMVRHGASQSAVPGQPFDLIDGHSDPPLAPDGVRQAERLAECLRGERIDRLFVTPLRRTQQTAAPLVAATGLEPAVVRELREVLLGDWEGGELRIRAANGDPLFARVMEEESWELIPGAEPTDGFAERVRVGLERIVAETGPGGIAVAITHGGVIGEACRQVTQSRPFAFLHAENCSITRLVAFNGGSRVLRSFNDVAHLSAR